MSSGEASHRRLAEPHPYLRPLAELLVRFGANVQPGQIVEVSSEPGKEHLARAVAEVAYAQGARFVDLAVFDLHFKRARALHADPETLAFVPPWYGQRLLALGEHRCARVSLAGPVEPEVMAGVDPERVGRDALPSLPESSQLLNERLTNWVMGPCPTPGWAALVYPQLEPTDALERLWQEIGHVCRLDDPDPVAAWQQRLGHLLDTSRWLDALELDELHFRGPGTDLRVGLLPGSRWLAARLETAGGIVHAPNIPTEEVFTTPDPSRTEGVVRTTKPLRRAGAMITGLRVRFEGGRAVEIDADQDAEAVRAMLERDPGAARLGEVALVDREGRIGPLGTTFWDTLLDENAASHLAFGAGYEFAVDDESVEQINRSAIHIDFMIGGDEVAVDGRTRAGVEVALLRGGVWQV